MKAIVIGGVRVCAWRTCKAPIPASRPRSPYCSAGHSALARDAAYEESRWAALLQRQLDDVIEGKVSPPQFQGYFSSHEGTFIDGKGTLELAVLADKNQRAIRQLLKHAEEGRIDDVIRVARLLSSSPDSLTKAVARLVATSMEPSSNE